MEIEQRPLSEIDLPKKVIFYVARMTNMFQLRDHLEAYPFTSFLGLDYGNANQLVKKTIFHSYNMLCALGYEVEADFLLNVDRQMHNGKAA